MTHNDVSYLLRACPNSDWCIRWNLKTSNWRTGSILTATTDSLCARWPERGIVTLCIGEPGHRVGERDSLLSAITVKPRGVETARYFLTLEKVKAR